MSSEKGETKRKKGLTWAEAAKQVSTHKGSRRSALADRNVLLIFIGELYINQTIFLFILGA